MVFGDVDTEFWSLGMLVQSSGLWDVYTKFCSLGMLTLSSVLWRCGRRLYSGV